MRLAFLGPAGTFGEEAAIKFALDAEFLPFPSHAAVAAAVEAGMADIGVIAIENLINGSVGESLDILIHETTLTIQAEIIIPVVHNLIAKPGTRADQVRNIFSHTQALGQCRKFIERCFPKAQVEAALSTTEAVDRALARDGDGSRSVGPLERGQIGAALLLRELQRTGSPQFLEEIHGTLRVTLDRDEAYKSGVGCCRRMSHFTPGGRR